MIGFCTWTERSLPNNKLNKLCGALGGGCWPPWTDEEIEVKRQRLSLATAGVGSGKDAAGLTGADSQPSQTRHLQGEIPKAGFRMLLGRGSSELYSRAWQANCFCKAGS